MYECAVPCVCLYVSLWPRLQPILADGPRFIVELMTMHLSVRFCMQTALSPNALPAHSLLYGLSILCALTLFPLYFYVVIRNCVMLYIDRFLSAFCIRFSGAEMKRCTLVGWRCWQSVLHTVASHARCAVGNTYIFCMLNFLFMGIRGIFEKLPLALQLAVGFW